MMGINNVKFEIERKVNKKGKWGWWIYYIIYIVNM